MSEQNTEPAVSRDDAQPVRAELYLFTDDHDTVCAADMDDAHAVWRTTNEDSYEDAVGDKFEECWHQIGDDEVITVRDDEGKGPETKTAKEWAASCQRGFLWSTDF